jgi:DNA-directed RNA polymerase specialized sigma24 family protein
MAGIATDSRIRRDAGHVARTDSWFQPDFSAADTHLVVSEALRKLPDPLRETVTLRLWGDLSFPEISSVTGVPVATATSRYRLAIERLRETLGPCFS